MPSVFRLAALAAAAASACPAPAALPPQYQRIAELRAVLDNSGVSAALGGMIDRVEYVRTDLYRVTVGRCHVDARIVDLPMPAGVVGARRFEVRAGQRACTR